MIKLERKPEPKVLIDKKSQWDRSLLDAIKKYGAYKDIPDTEKERLISHYRHKDIKSVLFSSSSEKCAFCECKPAEGGNIEVEHFNPKSIYPDKTFEWLNFLPSCRKCNGRKLDHDTIKEPIVNPYDQDPTSIFCYSDIKIKPIDEGKGKIGQSTIDVCGLNSVRLLKPRADMLVSLHTFAENIEEALTDYEESDTDRKKAIRLRKIGEAIEIIEQVTEKNEKYSGFCEAYLESCNTYIKAKKLLKS